MSNVLEIYVDGTSGIVSMNGGHVPMQDLTLVAYRVEFDTSAHALDTRLMHFSADWIRGNTIKVVKDDSIGGDFLTFNRTGVPLLIQHDHESNVYFPNMKVKMTRDITSDFNYSLTGFNSLTGFQNLTLIFNYENGTI